MGTFLALLGIRLGLALVSWGLGSAGSGAGPVVPTGRPCAQLGAPVRVLTAAPSTARRPLTALGSAPVRTLTAMPGPAEAC